MGEAEANAALQDESKAEAKSNRSTTLMIKNIPNNMKRKDLIAELEACPWDTGFNFVNLVFDPEKGTNAGYAFVNCNTPELADLMMKKLNGPKLNGTRWQKIRLGRHIRQTTYHLSHFEDSEADPGFIHSFEADPGLCAVDNCSQKECQVAWS